MKKELFLDEYRHMNILDPTKHYVLLLREGRISGVDGRIRYYELQERFGTYSIILTYIKHNSSGYLEVANGTIGHYKRETLQECVTVAMKCIGFQAFQYGSRIEFLADIGAIDRGDIHV